MPILLGVVSCFVLSGFAALLYQTTWMRQFSLVFGTSELAVAAVLAAYMGGLALGAGIAARYVHRIKRPVLFYGALEAGIAISALSVPLLLSSLNGLYIAVFGGQPEPVDASGLGQSIFYLATAFIVLAIPTAFMGATLPLLTKYVVRSEEQIGPRVGLLYATNTAGAVGGTVVAGFVLLPALGLAGTVYVGVAINVLVFFIAAAIAKAVERESGAELPGNQPAPAVEVARSSPLSGRFWVLPIMLLSGANSFVYEVLWTRLLGHILGGSITAFATMLASFLGGIAIGSAIASRFAKTKAAAQRLARHRHLVAGNAVHWRNISFGCKNLCPRWDRRGTRVSSCLLVEHSRCNCRRDACSLFADSGTQVRGCYSPRRCRQPRPRTCRGRPDR